MARTTHTVSVDLPLVLTVKVDLTTGALPEDLQDVVDEARYALARAVCAQLKLDATRVETVEVNGATLDALDFEDVEPETGGF